MKNKENRNIAALLIIAVCLATIAFATYLIPTDSFDRVKVYTEPLANISFAVPDSFGLERELISESQAFVKIISPNDISPANPGLGSVTVFPEIQDRAFAEQAAAYLSVSENSLVPFASLRESLAYVEQRGQEVSYYYFFHNQQQIIVFKFNKRYFDKANPMMLIDNSSYANVFLKTLNSMKYY